MNKTIVLSVFLSTLVWQGQAAENKKEYALWYTAPACNRGGDFTHVISRGFPFDTDWETWSLPIGNGAMGACIFGGTDTERIQISEKTLSYKGPYDDGGDKGTFTNFVEVYLDFNHRYYKNYKRSLCLDDAISTVSYEYDGVKYTREYFANYPSQAIVIKIKADVAGKVSFKLHPELPYLHPFDSENNGRTGTVTAKGDLITLRGEMQIHKQRYEGQIKVVNYGGSALAAGSAIDVNQADSVVLYIATGTDYKLNDNVFLASGAQKLQGNPDPHETVSQRIEQAANKGYDQLRKEHQEDYQKYFGRVSLQLTDNVPSVPTDKLLTEYKSGKTNAYLEELFFQYGRYLLISSSRTGSLPSNLQGAWSQYEVSPWSGGYWHNINVQMNYWPVFNTNLSDMFDSYMAYNEAFRKSAMQKATEYIKKNNPSALSKDGDNGWTIGTGATAFGIEAPGKHSGPGTGGFTTKLFWDYYDFTRDKLLLKEHVYPALYGMAKFLQKTLKEQPDGTLQVDPSFSPEQRHKGEHYQCKGCTFDQCMILETYRDLLHAASILKIKDPFLKTIEKEIPRLNPIEIGESGQIKEFREEKKYGDIGEVHHRHISHLCALYPGTMITSATPEWMKAAAVSLTMRGDKSTGWAMAHRQVSWARLKNGEKAYQLYKGILSERVMQNLWAFHPPFQIDANLGATAGVAEMLLQSHEGYIEPLPALPKAWKNGSYDGLMARGNFQISAQWKDGKAVSFCIVSNKGEICRLKYTGIENASITDNRGKTVKTIKAGDDLVEFKTKQGIEYTVTF